MPRVPSHLDEHAIFLLQGGIRTTYVAPGQCNKLQCPQCKMPKTVLQGDRKKDSWLSLLWQTTYSPRNVWELAVALVEGWGNISQKELASLVLSMRMRCTEDTHCDFWWWIVQGIVIPFLFGKCLWNLFILCLSCWIFLCSYNYLHMLRN